MSNNKVNNIYNEPITYDNIYKMWFIVKKSCKNKQAVYKFSINLSSYIYNIYNILINKKYKPLAFTLFMIFEPKERLVMSQSITDKIVNHFVANYYLLPYLEKTLIDSNVATRVGKGSSYANKLVKNYINDIRINEPNKKIYALKIDISKYFYNIDHHILIDKIRNYILDEDVINVIKEILAETNKPYINETICKYNDKYNTTIPLYKQNFGLSIGAMTSQFLAIFYLSSIDHYVKEKLHCRHYIRYMDDMLILDTDINKLKDILKIITYEINKLKLEVNPKSSIITINNGLNFVG